MSLRRSFSEKQELGVMISGLIQELIPPIHAITPEPGSVTDRHLSSLLHLGCARDLLPMW